MPDAKITVSGEDVSASEVLVRVGDAVQGTADKVDAFGSKADEMAGVISAAGLAAAGFGDSFGSLQDDLAGVTATVDDNRSAFERLHDGIAELGAETADSIKHGLEDPVGSAREAIEGMLDDLGPFATGLGVVATAAGAVGGAMFELAEKSADSGEHILDVSMKTGVSVDALSRLSNAAIVAGGSVDQIGTAMFMFERNVGQNPDKVAASFDKLGLSLDTVLQMKPDQQFMAIATAIANTEDPIQRNSAAMGIFGRSARDLMPLLIDINGAMEKTADISVWSPEQAKQAKEFEEDVRALKLQVEDFGVVLGKDLIPTMTAFVGLLRDGAPAAKGFIEALPGGFLLADRDALQQHVDALKKEADAQLQMPAVAGPATAALVGQRAATSDLAASGMNLFDAWTVQAAVLPGLIASNQAHLAASQPQVALLDSWTPKVREHSDAMSVLNKTFERGIALMPDMSDEQERANGTIQEALDYVEPLDSRMLDFGTVTIPNLTSSIQKSTTTWQDFDENIEGTLTKLPGLIEKGLTGGGGLMGALKAFSADIGGGLFTAGGPLNGLGNSITQGATDLFGGTVGNMVGSFIPGLGSLLGAGVSGLVNLFKGIGGPSQEEVQGRSVEAQFEQQMGGWQGIQQALLGTGMAADQVNAKIQALWAAEKQGGDAVKAQIDDINASLNQQTQDQADLQTAMQKYGLTVADMGAAFKQSQLDTQAQGLLNDWRLLVGAGADVSTVNDKMASSINSYLQLAQKTGTEVPSAMQPILQSMITQGTLLDANGNKITDMSQLGVSFSETMSQGFQKVVDKLDQLLQKIGMVPAAIAQIPTTIDISTNVGINNGGSGVVPMADGGTGTVTKPTLFLAGEKGPEQVAFSGANKTLSGGLSIGDLHAAVSQAMSPFLQKLDAHLSRLPFELGHAMRGAG